jgi:predicted ester cyclase
MPQVNTTLLYQWFQQVWNEGREEVINDLFDENAVAKGLNGDRKGPAAFKEFYHSFRDEFSDVQVSIEKVLAEDNMESALCSVDATHTATNKKVHFEGITMVRLEDGKIVEAWNQFDFLNLYLQLGHQLIPAQN